MDPIILASSSPRRQEILKMLNIPYRVMIPNYEEVIPDNMVAEQIPEFFAMRKIDAVAREISAKSEITWILGADTAIIHKNKVIGKPRNIDEAKEILTSLQGKTHKVVTGIALFNGELHYVTTRTAVTKVTMAPMTEDEIKWYLGTGEWHGAAGGYRIQGLASCFIKKIEGTNSNVVGLPIFELYDMLKEQNYPINV